MSNIKTLKVCGARENNLKNITVHIPTNKLVVITGLSGSGKSSLAFDTIYAEGQRRYVESLSAYARQFLELQKKPDIDHIEGLSPAISIEQKTINRNPRSNVGTVTEIYDYMRLLWARIGITYSPSTGKPIQSQTVSQMVDELMKLPMQTKLLITAPIVRDHKGEYKKELAELMKKGFQRVKIDNVIYEIEDRPKLNPNVKHTIAVIVDRIVVKEDIEQRLAESFEACLELTDGIIWIDNLDTEKKIIFSSKLSCPDSGFNIDEIEPRLFSFNNPNGACPNCNGLGTKLYFDPNLIIPNHDLTLAEGAISAWDTARYPHYRSIIQSLAKFLEINLDTPWRHLPEKAKDLILYGSGDTPIPITYDDGIKIRATNKPFDGVIQYLEKLKSQSLKAWQKEQMTKFQDNMKCHDCDGYRLNIFALAVKILHRHIGEICSLSILETQQWFQSLHTHLTEKEQKIAKVILREINDRLSFLINVGLEYLSLARTSVTLSGGESQRIRLASQIGCGLTGVMYVLDEPSIGLHQRDNKRLLETLINLRNMGNSVIVVEHDKEAILIADHVIDIGPGAGEHGGYIIAEGTPENIIATPQSRTGKYISGKMTYLIKKERQSARRGKWLQILGCSNNNLKNIDLKIPIGVMTCVTGVSGSGKSTLIMETLYPAIAQKLNNTSINTIGKHQSIHGIENFDKVIEIDQSPIGRTPRSNPATYTGAFSPIREWFAGLPESQVRAYTASRFSFNVKGGRCEACQGDGVIKIEMHFLPNVYVPCDICNSKRYNRETLEVKYKGYSINDILEMTVEAGAQVFESIPMIHDKLLTLINVGLGYIKIGQSAITLSGGEAQRIKLAKELSKRSTGRTLYILDEPTTGLHFDDIVKLMGVLQNLVDAGNTIIIIEHNLDVIKYADWIIDIGPEGGNKGGQIVGQGTPEDIISNPSQSETAYYLHQVFKEDQQNSEQIKELSE